MSCDGSVSLAFLWLEHYKTDDSVLGTCTIFLVAAWLVSRHTQSRLQSVLPSSRSLFVHLFYKTRVCGGGSNGCEPYECDMRTDTRRNVLCFVRTYTYVVESKFKDYCRSYRRQTGGNLLCSPPSSRFHNSDPHIYYGRVFDADT